ncbi:DoxX family protein [Microlunatus antarcticus]|uniref:Putative oxidoreductase n=1 Tax=Microlunatus antarcticus TaxID=53388 RepID=A0A7W5JXE4_9ACTN|nr:DoxX family protein [Microlunatus antarcticus]MBB3328089.1 putative oxidoreductase [Microlunatus antarcticus]
MSKSTDLGLLALRLGFGTAAASHGAQKLFGWFGGYGIEGTGGFFESVGFTPGKRNATLAGLAETGGGLAVALGLGTGAAGAALTGNMVVASSLHGFEKFFAADGGPETALTYGLVGTALTLTGAGRYSLDHLTGHVFDKPWLRVAAYAAAAGAATAIIIARRNELASRPPAPEVPAEGADDAS